MSFYGINPENLPVDPRFEHQGSSSIREQANLGAALVHEMFGFDVSQVQDDLEADYAKCGTSFADADNRPFVALTLAQPRTVGITPGQLVAGYNKLAGLNSRPTLDVWDEMYLHRDAAWWNRRTSSEVSRMTTKPLFGAVVLDDLLGTSKPWEVQKKELKARCDLNYTAAFAVEGMTPLDYLMLDAANILSGAQRLKRFTRFVQHERDVEYDSHNCGPKAVSWRDGQTSLGGSSNGEDEGEGYRLVLGPKA